MNNQVSIFGSILLFAWHGITMFLLTEPRFSKKKNITIWVATVVSLLLIWFVLMVTIGFEKGVLTLGLISLVVNTSVMLFTSADCVPKKVFLIFTYYNYFFLTVQFSFAFARLFFEEASIPYQILSIVMRNVLQIIFVPLYFKFVHPKFRAVKVSRNSEWWILTVISALFTVVYITQAMVVNRMWSLPVEYMPVLVAIFLQGAATLLVVFRTISYMNKTAEAELMEQNTRFLTERIERLTQSEDKMRQLRHDMRHHLTNIAEHIKKGDSSAALEYLEQCDEELSGTAIVRYCENNTLDNIISAYARRAENAGIDFSCKAHASAELPIKDTHLVAILANLLENALNGCLDSGTAAPEIEVFVSEKDRRLVIVINNSCRGDLLLNGKFPKDKGIGISSVISAVERNNGVIDYTVKDGICSVCAALGL